MKKLLRMLLFTLPFVAFSGAVEAQNVAIKTNLAMWGMYGTPNLGVEIALGKKTTLDLEGMYNPWDFTRENVEGENRKLQFWAIAPEIKFWHWEKFNRGYIGIHLLTGSFNMGGMDKLPFGLFPAMSKYRYEGVAAGIGFSYGWQWYLSPHWNFEASIGLGYMYVNYNQFKCEHCGDKLASNVGKHYFGPTKVGLSFSYLFGSKK